MTSAADPPASTRRSSDLSKHSAEVFAEAEDHPVTVTRRDGESLVLMSQREADARAELLDIAGALITATLEDGPLTERMASRYPWMYALSAQDRKECARDLVDAARASFSTQQPHLAIAQLTGWRETATAIAAGLGSQPVEWLEEDTDAVDDDRQADLTAPEGAAVPRPMKGSDYVLKHATKQSEKGWRDLATTLGDPMSDAWDFLTRTPLATTSANYPLEGSLGVVTRGGRIFQRWQHQPTTKSTAQIWFYVDGGTVHLERVHAAHRDRTK
jgi:dsDNA-binding SOS-regulon protein